jgi:beta-galactosidase
LGRALRRTASAGIAARLTCRQDDSGKRIWLAFDGVFRDATVWVNGWLVRRHEGGYYPFP